MNKVALGLSAFVLSLLSAGISSAIFSSPKTLPVSDYLAAVVASDQAPTNEAVISNFMDLSLIMKLISNAPVIVVGDPLEADDSATTTDAEAATATPADIELPPMTTAELSQRSVRISCIQVADGYKRTVSGTGFLINQDGVIMTNAHVAQFLLLKDAPGLGTTECSAIVGNSEAEVFAIDLLYISPTWLLEHASLIGSATPKGTGESDFALIYINAKADGSAVGQKFAYLPPATNPLSKSYKNKEVTIVGYPKQTDKAAPQLVATTTITHLYTFGSGYADIFALASSSLGYQGASGGPVIDDYGRAIGMLTTKDEGTTILNAITVAHIDRRLLVETKSDLASYLQGDIAHKAQRFNETISPVLQELLSRYLAE